MRHFCHASNGIYWRDATEADIAAMETATAAKKSGKPVKTAADMKDLVPGDGAIPKVELLKLATNRGFSRNLAASTLKGTIENRELFEWKIKRSGTNDEVRISRHPQSPGEVKG